MQNIPTEYPSGAVCIRQAIKQAMAEIAHFFAGESIFEPQTRIMSTTIRLGTRGSELALWQAHFVKAELEKLGHTCELIIIKTKGDLTSLSFDKIEGKGFFTKELEDALLSSQIDMAVHSMKDLPTDQPEGLALGGVSYRQDPADWLLIHPDHAESSAILKLPANAIVGTSSVRRKAQLLDIRPDLELKDLRGNVPTRIRKLREGGYHAIMLAAAGLQRLELDLSDLVVMPLHPREFVPAPAQGVLAYQCRRDDASMKSILKQLHQSETARLSNVERRVLQLMEGGCHIPLGVYCESDRDGHYHVWAAYSPGLGQALRRIRYSSSTSLDLAETIVHQLKADAGAL